MKGNTKRTQKKLDEEQLAQVEALAAYLSQDQIAEYFGIKHTSWHLLLRRQPEAVVRYKKGKAKAIGSVARGLLQQALGGDKIAAMFYLKTQAGWRETAKVEIGTDDQEPVQIVIESKKANDETEKQKAIRDNTDTG